MQTGPTAYLAGVDSVIVLEGVAAAVLRLVAQSFSRMVHAIFAARSGEKKCARFRISPITNQERAFQGTHPQLRHSLEQVKYSSGKKQLLAASSPVISPLKRSLSACTDIAHGTKLVRQRC